jgi:hypothetical protein
MSQVRRIAPPLTIVSEVSGPDRFPSRPRIGVHGPAADQAVPVHVPDRGLAAARVLPQDVGMAVVVEIAGSDLGPARPRIRAHRPAADQGVPVHVPDRGLAVRVLPKDVAVYWRGAWVVIDHGGRAVDGGRAVGAAQVAQCELRRRGRAGRSRGRRENERVEFAGDRGRFPTTCKPRRRRSSGC